MKTTNNRAIEFIRTKDFIFIEEIGQGGTGKTVLLKDELIDELFVCKKYAPFFKGQEALYFKNFIDEIKILHKIFHNNIVRIFNYYLYPEKTTGYILMEYIKGQPIDTYIKNSPHLINDTFEQTINGFKYLEQNGILHRDIRPDNIIVSDGGIVKIIDFGFGKKTKVAEHYDKSISLNWKFSPPKDFENGIYDFRTEIYFVGKLFEEAIRENEIDSFLYKKVLSEMIKMDYHERISTFEQVDKKILSYEDIESEFSFDAKQTYRQFAGHLTQVFSKIERGARYSSDIEKILGGLETVYRNSLLEEFIQNPSAITGVFVEGNYRYFKKNEFPVSVLRDFIKLIKPLSVDKKILIMNNLQQRLDAIERFTEDIDDLPF